MKKIFLATTSLAVLASIEANAIEVKHQINENHEIGSHAYARLGTGIGPGSSDGSNAACYQAPGAWSKYRYGNECDYYGEYSGYHHYTADDGMFTHTEVMFNQFAPEEDYTADGFGINQAFFEIGNMEATGDAVFWAGRRFYDRQQVGLTDFYWLNTSTNGYGGGVYNVPFVKGTRLAYALTRDDVEFDLGSDGDDDHIYQWTHDIRLSDIKLNDTESLKFVLNYAHAPDETDNAVKYAIDDGYALTAIHEKKDFIYGGENKLAIQYGTSLMRNFSSNGLSGSVGGIANAEDTSTFRIVNDYKNTTAIEDHGIETTFVYQYIDAGTGGDDSEWWSLGAKDTWMFHDNYRAVFEAGFDYTDSDNGTDGLLSKFTTALEWAPVAGKSIWNRPVLRLYATQAFWSEDFKGQVASESYGDDTQGMSVGVQMEIWF